MRIRYEDGYEDVVTIDIQARIWQVIKDEAQQQKEVASKRPSRGTRNEDSLETKPILDLVRTVLDRIPSPYPTDITDQVCLTIEKDPEFQSEYDDLVKHFSSRGKDGKNTVNTSIGSYTKEETGMITLKDGNPSKSKLMKTYSTLGYRK